MFRKRAFWGFGAFEFTFRGSPAKKHQSSDPFSDFADFQRKSLQHWSPKSKLPLNAKITPQRIDFRLEVTNQEFLSRTGGSTGSVFFKMAAAAILCLEKLLPFLYYWTDLHQIWWESFKFSTELNRHVENAHSTKFKMAAAAILNSNRMLPFLYY